MKMSFTVQGAEKYSNPTKEAMVLGPKLGHPFGKSTCHHLWSLKVLDAQSCLTLWDPMDCSPPGSSVRGILQARTLEWVAVPSSGGSSQPKHRTHMSCTAGRFSTVSATGLKRHPHSSHSECFGRPAWDFFPAKVNSKITVTTQVSRDVRMDGDAV